MQLLPRQEVDSFPLPRSENSNAPEMLDIELLLAIVRRQWPIVALSVVIFLLIGIGYLMTAVSQYTASTRILIDRGNSEIVQQLSTIGGFMDDEASVLSQVEVLQSEVIGLRVIDKLDLLNDTRFTAQSGSPVATVKKLIRSAVNVTQWFSPTEESLDREAARNDAVTALSDGLSVSRVGRTYVLEISYTSTSPELSAEITNAYASEYVVDKLNAKYEATRRASDWLVDRISELRQKALESDMAVQKFRAEHGLIETGNSGLVSDQQLAELNSALIVAQSDTAKAKARLERIQQILASDETDAVVTDILDSSVANDLRKKYLEASKLEAEIAARLGANHVQAIRLRGEMSEYRRLMFEEVSRVAQSYKSDLEVAEARHRALLDSVAKATGVSATASETQVQMRELQREAETYRNLYQTFLQRHQEAVQQQSFPVTETRVISRAVTPDRPSKPKKPLVLALFGVLGIAFGSGIGAFREFRDRFFRTGDQVRDVLGLEFLGNTPKVENVSVVTEPTVSSAHEERKVSKTSTLSDYVVHYPLSSFAETLRSARLAIDFAIAGAASKTIGIISVLPGEGKSTISVNFAQLLAAQGARVVLVDADIRNPGATRELGRKAKAGLLEVLLEGRDYRELLLGDPKSGLLFLPAVIKQRVPHSSELLMSGAMRKLLADLAGSFDYVIVDLPPIGPVIDARAIAGRIDGFLMVTEWGQTSRRVVRHTLETEPVIREKCVGVILNKVDQKKLNLYRIYGSGEYYQSRYHKYYHSDG